MDVPESTSEGWSSMSLNTTPDPFFGWFTKKLRESIRKKRRKNVNIVRVMTELFFNFKYRTLFRSDNYLGIISGSAWKKRRSFRGRDHFRVDFGIISGLAIISGRDHFGGCTKPCGSYTVVANNYPAKCWLFTWPSDQKKSASRIQG